MADGSNDICQRIHVVILYLPVGGNVTRGRFRPKNTQESPPWRRHLHGNDNLNLEIHEGSAFLLACGLITKEHKQKSSRGHVTLRGTYIIISCCEANVSTLWFHAGWGYNNCLELLACIIRPL